MAGLSETLSHLARVRAAAGLGTVQAQNAGARAGGRTGGRDGGRLHDFGDFGSNPGALRALSYVPDTPAGDGLPLVVVLHGCTQTAAAYDHGAGWSALAERCGFALLFPEQQRGNNGNLCFNWFAAEDIGRDRGEALSIRQMIATMVRDRGIDPARVFVTGLSAGGAMAAVMLATYPEVFAGGAIIAGLPYGSATSLSEALGRMGGRGLPDGAALTALVRGASRHQGDWPRVSVWHGTDDATVTPANADAVVAQWRGLHGVAPAPDLVEQGEGHVRRVWNDAAGHAAIEDYRIAGLGHGTPLASSGEGGIGNAGPHMLEAGISSTEHIAAFFGLAAAPAKARSTANPEPVSPRKRPAPSFASPAGQSQIGDMINGALRAAGLLR